MCQVLSLLAIKTPRATSDELSGVINFEQSQYNIERMKLVLLFITLNINLYLRTCLFLFFFFTQERRSILLERQLSSSKIIIVCKRWKICSTRGKTSNLNHSISMIKICFTNLEGGAWRLRFSYLGVNYSGFVLCCNKYMFEQKLQFF